MLEMHPALAIDPNILAFPTNLTDESSVEQRIAIIVSLSEHFRKQNDSCAIYLLSNVCEYLANADLFPTPNAISQVLNELNLAHVYATEDIRRSINLVLSKSLSLEDVSEIQFIVPESFSAQPDIIVGPKKELREALEITLLHLALLTSASSPKLFPILIANDSVSGEIKIDAKISLIDPPFQGKSEVDSFSSIVCVVNSIKEFLEKLDGKLVWQHAREQETLRAAISCEAQRIRKSSGCLSPAANCEPFIFGNLFVESLRTWAAMGDGKNSGLAFEACARIVAGYPKNEVNRFFRPSSGKNKTEDVTRAGDNAEAWRTHLTKDGEALRLMFWRRSDGTIEFANIGAKADLEIL